MWLQGNLRASRVVRLALAACSVCWVPPCAFALLAVASQAGAVGNTEESLAALARFRGISAMVNPLFGLVLYLTMEACFNLRHRYNMSFHRKLRRLRWKLCGAPKNTVVKSKKDKKNEQEAHLAADDHEAGILVKLWNSVGIMIWQCTELVIFAPWALAVWLPMDTFRKDVSSNYRLASISTAYMIFLAMPAVVFFMLLPLFYQTLDQAIADGPDLSQNATKINLSVSFGFVYVCYAGIILKGASNHLASKVEDDESEDIVSDKFCIENDELCIKMMNFV